MRLDKYLKVSKVIKRRTIAKDLAIDDRVFINNKLAKPSSEVGVGDTILIKFEHRHIELIVTFVSEKMNKNNPPMFEIVSETKIEKSQP